jgi:hypothetical protein
LGKIITLFSAGIGLLVSFRVLISKSDLERVFLSPEQTTLMNFFRLIGISASIGILVADIYYVWFSFYEGKTTETIEWNFIAALGLVVFVLCLCFLDVFKKILFVFFARYHYKYKVNIENLGEVYIHKMMNAEVCICSKDPNSDIKKDDSESLLIRLEDLMKKPIIKIKVQRPQTVIQKLFKYNQPIIKHKEGQIWEESLI